MTRPHTQRPAMQPLHAIEEIERCSGRQFDPRITAALGRVLTSLARHDERFAAPVRR
jgi:HD-GYP domain-containing protein (c-di-GMP phosphodiesterase class II)